MSLLSAVIQEAEKASTEDFMKLRNPLYTKIINLTEKIKMLTWSLQQSIIDTYVTFIQTKSLEQLNYKNRKESILSEYDIISKDIMDLKTKFKVSEPDFLNASKNLDKSSDLLRKLIVTVEAKRKLEMANHEFTRFKYSEAMTTVKDVLDSLLNLNLDGDLSKALVTARCQAENQYSIYSANLSLEWEDIFSWTEKKGVHSLTYSLMVQQSDPSVVETVLKTLHMTKRLNLELGLFAHFFIEKLLHNVVRHNCDIFTEDKIAPNHTIVFNIKIDLDDTTKPSFQTVFSNLMAVFEFLQTTLGEKLDSENTFIAIFAESIKDKFFDKIIEDCIRNNLPSCDSSYVNYKNLVIELDSFNKFLIELRFVDAEESPLNKFVRDTECVLYDKKCDKLLFDVRNLLGQSLSYGTVTVGVQNNESESVIDVTDKLSIWDLSRPLFLPQCVISQNVQKILGMIVEHLSESTKLPDKYAFKLVSYIRSIAVLYQCMVPKKFKVNLECCPFDIALFFNNCFYLAHGLLGPPWRNMLSQPVAEKLTLIMTESIQDLRVLGLEKISLYLESRKSVIMKNIQPEDHKQWSYETFDQFDGAISDTTNLLMDLKQNWLRVLPNRMYELSLCMLIQGMCQAVLERLFVDNKPIDEDLVYLIAMRLEDMIQGILMLFETPIEFEKKIDVWSKFTKLPLLLKGQLLELSRLWKEDAELSSSYTCEEVRQIIKMRFPEDKYRLKILMEIQ